MLVVKGRIRIKIVRVGEVTITTPIKRTLKKATTI